MVTPGSELPAATCSSTGTGSGRKDGPEPVSRSSPPAPPETREKWLRKISQRNYLYKKRSQNKYN